MNETFTDIETIKGDKKVVWEYIGADRKLFEILAEHNIRS